MSELAINLNDNIFESLFPGRKSSQSIIKELIKEINLSEIKISDHNNIPLSDEIQIWDIDLKKFDLKSLHEDGYYIDENLEVRRLSDHAIAYLRAAYPNKKIASNRVLGKKENFHELIANSDIENINLKNIHADGYYIYADGTVERLSDEYILLLREMFNDESIAKNRKIATNDIDVIAVDNSVSNKLSLVRDNSVKVITDGFKAISDLGNTISLKVNEIDVKEVGLSFKDSIKDKIKFISDGISTIYGSSIKNLRVYKSRFVKNAVLVKDKTVRFFGSIKRISMADIPKSSEVIVERPTIDVKKMVTDSAVSIKNGFTKVCGNVNVLSKKLITNCKLVKDNVKKFIVDTGGLCKKVACADIPKYIDDVARPSYDFGQRVSDVVSKVKDIDVKEISSKAINKFKLIKNNAIKYSIKSLNAFKDVMNVNIDKYQDDVIARRPIVHREEKKSIIKNLSVNYDSFRKVFSDIKKSLMSSDIPYYARKDRGIVDTLLTGELPKNRYAEEKIAKRRVSLIKGLYRFAKTPSFARTPLKITIDNMYHELGGNDMENRNRNLFVRLYDIANTPIYGRNKNVTYAGELRSEVKKFNNENKKIFKLIKGPAYDVANFDAVKVLGKRIAAFGAAAAVATIAFANSLTSVKAQNVVNPEDILLFKEEQDSNTKLKFDMEKGPVLRGCTIILNDEESEDDDLDPLSYYDFSDGELYFSQTEEPKKEDSDLTLSIEKEEKVLQQKLFYNEYEVENRYSYLDEDDLNTEDVIRKYCNIYNVNFDEVYNLLVTLTDNFTSDDYVNNLTIPGINCKRKQVYASSYEELLMLAVRSIAQVPSNFKINYTRLYSCDYYVSDNDYANQISHIAKLFNLDRCLIYAIIYTETNFKSDLFIKRNNPAGLMDNAQYITFSTKEEGFIELCTEIRKYNDMGAYTLEQMAKIHCEGNPKWAPVVREVYESTKLNEKSIFGDELVQQKTLNR